MSRYTQLALNAFNKIQMNAGVLCKGFDTSTGTVTGIMGVTSGGIAFNAAYTYSDFGEDMDNVPKNTKELKRIDSVEVKCSGTFATVDANLVKSLMGAVDTTNTSITDSLSKIVPSNNLLATDFEDLWIVGDYSSDTDETTGGFCAIHMISALSTGGFQMQTTDKEKGKFAFEFTAHYAYATPNLVPYEVYLKVGTAAEILTVAIEPSQTTSNAVKVTVLGYGLKSGEIYKYKVVTGGTAPTIGSSTASGYTNFGSNPNTGIAANAGQTIHVVASNTSTNTVTAVGSATVVRNSGVLANVEPTPTEGD